jgi:hypothetical protein
MLSLDLNQGYGNSYISSDFYKYMCKFLANKYKVSKTYPNSRLSSPFKPQIDPFSSASRQQQASQDKGGQTSYRARGIKLGNGAVHTYTIWRELQNITNLEDDWVALVAIQYKVNPS